MNKNEKPKRKKQKNVGMNALIEAFCVHKVSIATFYSISCLFIDIIQIFMAFVHRLAFCCFMSNRRCVPFFLHIFISFIISFPKITYQCLSISGATTKNCKNQSEKKTNANICCCRFFFVFIFSCAVSLSLFYCNLLFAHIQHHRSTSPFQNHIWYVHLCTFSVLGFNTFYFVYCFSCVALFSLVPMPIISFRCTIYIQVI